VAGAGRGPVGAPRRLDEVDRQIIEALQDDGRASFRGIAAQAGVSEATVRARYGLLRDDGVISILAVTNPLALGFEQALVGVRTTGNPDEIAEEVVTWPETDYVVVTAGQFDLIVEVVSRTRRQLIDLTNRLRGLDGVFAIETFVYLQMCKQLYNWGARAAIGEGTAA
jgi:Lrp/AsnC family transcriptional regulator for asnA, asnC and gidA